MAETPQVTKLPTVEAEELSRLIRAALEAAEAWGELKGAKDGETVWAAYDAERDARRVLFDWLLAHSQGP